MQNDTAVENLKKLLTAMEELLEAVKIQQSMIKMIAEQQIKTADYLIQIGKTLNNDKKTYWGSSPSKKTNN